MLYWVWVGLELRLCLVRLYGKTFAISREWLLWTMQRGGSGRCRLSRWGQERQCGCEGGGSSPETTTSNQGTSWSSSSWGFHTSISPSSTRMVTSAMTAPPPWKTQGECSREELSLAKPSTTTSNVDSRVLPMQTITSLRDSPFPW